MKDREMLVAALRERGVDYLAPSDAISAPNVDDESLITSLAGNSDPRLQQALVALFLTRPHLASLAPSLHRQLDADKAERLAVCYMAAVYLQRMWRVRLKRHIGCYMDLPDHFSAQLHLPAVSEGNGKVGLYALAEREKNRGVRRLNRLSEFEGVAAQVLQSLRDRAPQP